MESVALMTRKWLAILVSALLATGCASLQPVDTPEEHTPAPAHTAFWNAIDSAESGDWHYLLNDGPTALDWRLKAIDSATDSIELQTFLWSLDTVGRLVIDHLLDAADRGVSVRILVDDSFLVAQEEFLAAFGEHANIEYRVFNPYKRRHGQQLTRELLNLGEFHRLDHRMHNKAMVVDNQLAIVGGRNLADEYFGLHSDANFRDLEMIVGGAIVEDISATFDDYWNDQWSFPIETISHTRPSSTALAEARLDSRAVSQLHVEKGREELLGEWLAVVAAADPGQTTLYADKPPGENPGDSESAPVQVGNELIALFDSADTEIVIVSAYLIPTPDLEGAVARALGRGVDVRMLTNSLRSNNHVTAHSAYRKHIHTLLEQGASLHEVRADAQDRTKYMLSPVERKLLALHAKALIIDNDEVFIGSTNLDPRSLRINTEMGLLVTSRSFNQAVRDAVDDDFSSTNAWHLQLEDDGNIVWVSGNLVLDIPPANSFMQRIEDWFFALLPIEDEM